ncbi:MAG: hypothetical protein QM747_05620 [Nocardioides sp.]
MHGKEKDPADVAYTSFIKGTASSHLPPNGVIDQFLRADLERHYPQIVAGVARAATQVAAWTEEFATVRTTLDSLLASPGEDHRYDPRAYVPSSWALRLFTAAALAAAQSLPEAPDLAGNAIKAAAPWLGGRDRLIEGRIERLTAELG